MNLQTWIVSIVATVVGKPQEAIAEAAGEQDGERIARAHLKGFQRGMTNVYSEFGASFRGPVIDIDAEKPVKTLPERTSPKRKVGAR